MLSTAPYFMFTLYKNETSVFHLKLKLKTIFNLIRNVLGTSHFTNHSHIPIENESIYCFRGFTKNS